MKNIKINDYIKLTANFDKHEEDFVLIMRIIDCVRDKHTFYDNHFVHKGVVLDTSSNAKLSLFYTYEFVLQDTQQYTITKIENKVETEKLDLLYKMYLLKKS